MQRQIVKTILWLLDPVRRLRRRYAPRLGLGLLPVLGRASAWLKYGWRRPFERQAPGAEGRVVVAGLHGSIVGLGEAVRATSQALRQAGFEVHDWDLSALFSHPRQLEAGDPAPPPPGRDPIIVQMNALELIRLVGQVGGRPFAGRRCIGYWAWELETPPASWKWAFAYVDEIWTPSDFTTEAVRRIAPRRITVRTMHHPVKTPAVVPADRARFGLPETGAVVLSAFDLRSGMGRKNPMAAVAAFHEATRERPDSAVLVLKVGGIAGNEQWFEQLREAVAGDPRVRLFTEKLSEVDRDRLVATADIILSLHRSEGFGLLMAEAMLAGKPVVATQWSGNLDFMTPDCARLVPVTLIPVEDPQQLFVHGRWAEPDAVAAAAHLRELIDDPALRERLGEAGRSHARAVLDVEVLSRRMAGWIAPDGRP